MGPRPGCRSGRPKDRESSIDDFEKRRYSIKLVIPAKLVPAGFRPGAGIELFQAKKGFSKSLRYSKFQTILSTAEFSRPSLNLINSYRMAG